MQGYNHIAGGLVFTGIFSSFHDVNVFSSPLLIGTTVACALLPDIDHTQSVIGYTFNPIASFLQTRFGHRTITHSLFFYLGCVGLLWLLPRSYTVCGAYALLSHLLFDMCTKQGVPLLYPFSKRPFVLPANPGLRLSAQDHRSEAIVFVVFIALGSFCQPLIAKGFWTTYNEAFATWEHVDRESKRSGPSSRRDLLRVTWSDRSAGPSQKRIHSGLFYRAEGTTSVVLTTNGFELPKASETTLISFSHSGITATQQQHTVSNIKLDSLNQLLTSYCLAVQIQSAEQDLTYFDGPLMKVGRLIDQQYRKNLIISQPPHDDTQTINRIDLLRIDRETQRRTYLRALQEYNREMRKANLYRLSLQKLATEFGAASDYRKGQIIMERKGIKTKLEAAEANEPLPPIAPDLTRFDLQEQLLRKLLIHDSRISANIITITTSKPLAGRGLH